MKSEVISGILAQALVKLPRITTPDLFDLCKNDIGDVGLAQFRIEVSAWIKNNIIPGYEFRKGKAGGIYKKGSPNESNANEELNIEIDPTPIAETLDLILNNQTHITASELYNLVVGFIPTVTENQFRPIISTWIKNNTIPGYEIKKGPRGGIYRVDPNSDKSLSTAFESENIEQSEGSFTVEISPTIRIVKSDDRNWAIQKKSGETWISRYYHSDLVSALNSCVRHILNGEFKLADSTMIHIKDTIKVLKEIEKKIELQLKTITNQ